jgi:hypothetical protein
MSGFPVIRGRVADAEETGYDNGDTRQVRLDAASHALIFVGEAEHHNHEGAAFWGYYNAVLGNAEVLTMSFTTPNTTKWAHLTMDIQLTASCTLDILEDVTSFAGGVAHTIRNFNRNSAGATGMTITHGHTGSDLITPTGGSEIYNETLGSRGFQTNRSNGTEMIMKQNSKYLFRITNGASSNSTSIVLDWYEHVSRD